METPQTALPMGFTVQEMLHLALSAAPPYAPFWDPVLIVAVGGGCICCALLGEFELAVAQVIGS